MSPGRLPRLAAAGLAVASLASCMPSHRMTPVLEAGRACPAEGAASWYFPETEGDNRRLEEWCSTVGPEVFVSEPPGRFGPVGPADSLAVVAWNSAVGSGDVLAFLHDELDLTCEGPESRLAPGSPHFVLLVQEAFRRSDEVPATENDWATPMLVPEEPRPGERLDTPTVARRCGLSLAYVAAARNGHEPVDGMREDKGVAILSTLPLTDMIAIELPYEASRRVAVAATLRGGPGNSLRVASVHLISTAPPARVLTTGNGSRLRQGLALADALDQVEAERAPAAREGIVGISTVLAGDFNTWSDRETTLRRLRDRFPDSPAPLGTGTHGPFPTDHILFRSATAGPAPRLIEGSYERLKDSHHSDHEAVRVVLTFRE